MSHECRILSNPETRIFLLFQVFYNIVRGYVHKKKGGKRKMEYKKSLFGRTVIDSSDSDEINQKIELEYYETRNLAEKNERKYGIEVIKKREMDEKFNIESKIVNNISNEETQIDRLLETLMLNKVTPISVDDVISDISVLD